MGAHEQVYLDKGSSVICRHCGKDNRRTKEEKAAKVRASLLKRKKRGLAIGRPKERNDVEIQRLRRDGWTMREIAQLMGYSIAKVQRGSK